MLFLRPVLLKSAATVWTFARRYLGADDFQPWEFLLFGLLLGPLVVGSTKSVIIRFRGFPI
jgi:hypothetical protein